MAYHIDKYLLSVFYLLPGGIFGIFPPGIKQEAMEFDHLLFWDNITYVKENTNQSESVY